MNDHDELAAITDDELAVLYNAEEQIAFADSLRETEENERRKKARAWKNRVSRNQPYFDRLDDAFLAERELMQTTGVLIGMGTDERYSDWLEQLANWQEAEWEPPLDPGFPSNVPGYADLDERLKQNLQMDIALMEIYVAQPRATYKALRMPRGADQERR